MRQTLPEAAHQVVLMAFLQRVVNGGGYVEREYGLGRGRIDLLVRWLMGKDEAGRLGGDRHGLELKVWRQGKADPAQDGLKQVDEYFARIRLTAGTLVIFDARAEAPPWDQRGSFEAAVTPGGRAVQVWRF